MNLTVYKAPILEGKELVQNLLINEFHFDSYIATYIADNAVKPHFEKFIDSCYILAESIYVDRVFRDSYYHYYSSKLSRYHRDCIRLTFFTENVDIAKFHSPGYREELSVRYGGFIILRPTIPNVIGRSVISPKILKNNNFQACFTNIQTTCHGIKFSVEGFPHSSQDAETISCAETTLWAIMEYFSNKYPDYCPVLPSKIISTLNKVTTERQLPSRGLNIQQLSFALREFGFGTRIYSKEEYDVDFERLISTYIESGIPLIIGIDNRPDGNIGHAVLCIGHENITPEQIDQLAVYPFTNTKLQNTIVSNNIKVYDYDSASRNFIFIDDNLPVYQKAMLSEPTLHYGGDWQNCRIKHFIAPLYHKVYLDAFEAKNFILSYLIQGPEPLPVNSELLIKVYLTSSRSFKDGLSLEPDFQPETKNVLLELTMPKFIWVGELSSKELIKQSMASGLVILDATEPNIFYSKPLIFAAFNGMIIKLNQNEGRFEKELLPLPPFKCFVKNLRNPSV
ncbi:MAG: hypothetical protein EOM90_07425 [Alphaproteobacteria bacterium]|nr:hypothetical protein [Alphaproteobacteria bacterium]